jgi:cell division ATPase FtsA
MEQLSMLFVVEWFCHLRRLGAFDNSAIFSAGFRDQRAFQCDALISPMFSCVVGLLLVYITTPARQARTSEIKKGKTEKDTPTSVEDNKRKMKMFSINKKREEIISKMENAWQHCHVRIFHFLDHL